MITRYPLSSMAVFGFGVTTYGLALVAQSLSWRAIDFNLLSPRETFEWTAAFQAVIILAHFLYTKVHAFPKASQILADRVLRPIWIFRMPTAPELWMLGAMGIGSTWISRILYADAVDFGNVGGKFLQALVPFIVAPFFIPFRSRFLLKRVSMPRFSVPLLVGYFSLVVATAVFFNARAVFAVVLLTIILSAVLLLLMRRYLLTVRAKTFLLIGAFLLIPVLTVAQDLATAMQIARFMRGSATSSEIAMETVRAMGDRDALARFRRIESAKTADSGYSGFSEIYIHNEFLQRLSYTKYTDLTIAASLQLTDHQRDAIRQDAVQGIIAILPTPIINFLHLPVDKSNRGFSTGDVYANLAFNQELGGYRSGSSITNSIDVLSYFWPVAIGLIALVMFIFLDSYTLQTRGGVMLSALAFIQLYQIFARGLVYDSFRELVDGITRGYVQAIVVYTILTLIARFAVMPLALAFAPRERLAIRRGRMSVRVPKPGRTSG